MSILGQVEELIPKIELEEAGDLEADGNEVPSQNKVRETDDAEVNSDNNNADLKIAEIETEASKETAVDEETVAAAMGAATAAAAAGVAAAASTNGNSGASVAKSTLKYNPIGE